MISRIKSDAADREKLRTTLSTFIDPLDPSSHPDGTVNIAPGLVSPNNVNVDKSEQTGRHQMVEFESGWPANFHDSFKKHVIIMSSNKSYSKLMGNQCMTLISFTPESWVFSNHGI